MTSYVRFSGVLQPVFWCHQLHHEFFATWWVGLCVCGFSSLIFTCAATSSIVWYWWSRWWCRRLMCALVSFWKKETMTSWILGCKYFYMDGDFKNSCFLMMSLRNICDPVMIPYVSDNDDVFCFVKLVMLITFGLLSCMRAKLILLQPITTQNVCHCTSLEVMDIDRSIQSHIYIWRLCFFFFSRLSIARWPLSLDQGLMRCVFYYQYLIVTFEADYEHLVLCCILYFAALLFAKVHAQIEPC